MAAGAFGRFITVSQQKEGSGGSQLFIGGGQGGDDAQTEVDRWEVVGKPEARSKPGPLWVGERCTAPPSLSLLLLPFLLPVKEVGNFQTLSW